MSECLEFYFMLYVCYKKKLQLNVPSLFKLHFSQVCCGFILLIPSFRVYPVQCNQFRMFSVF